MKFVLYLLIQILENISGLFLLILLLPITPFLLIFAWICDWVYEEHKYYQYICEQKLKKASEK